ncbi:MAG TPA: permease [Candidatus Binatia bacterium]|nr:permease [Candidatus Binatia bacterium]
MFGQLLPEALFDVGLPALLVFALALAVPATLERLAHARHRRHGAHHDHGQHADDHAAGLELGYAALVIHSFGDGLTVGALADPLHGGDAWLPVTLSIAAHTVPVTALFAVAFASQRGTRSAVLRAAWLGCAMAVGVLAAGAVPPAVAGPIEPWLTAAVAGLLLHVIAHDWPVEPLRTPGERALELLAVAAGLALLLAGGHAGSHDGHGTTELGATFVRLALATAPLLLLGVVAGATVEASSSRLRAHARSARSLLGEAARGWLLGGVRQTATCQPLGGAAALGRAGAAPAAVLAFLVGAPQLAADAFALSVGLLGWPLAIARVATGSIVAFAVALAAAPLADTRANDADATVLARESAARALPFERDTRTWVERFARAGDALLFRTGAWIVAGLVAATYAELALPDGALARFATSHLDLLLVTAAALPAAVCPAAAIPLAAVLVAKGISSAAALAGLVVAPAIGIPAIASLARSSGRRTAIAAVAVLVGGTWSIALVCGALGVRADVGAVASGARSAGPIATAALVALALLVARSVWRSGLRAWLASLGEAFAAPEGATATVEPGQDRRPGSAAATQGLEPNAVAADAEARW